MARCGTRRELTLCWRFVSNLRFAKPESGARMCPFPMVPDGAGTAGRSRVAGCAVRCPRPNASGALAALLATHELE